MWPESGHHPLLVAEQMSARGCRQILARVLQTDPAMVR